MKKINFILLVLSCIFAFAACSKNDGDDDVPKPEMKYKQVKQIVFHEGNYGHTTTTFNYDEKGRIIEEIRNNERYTYTYNDNQIVRRYRQDVDEIYTLGDDGKVTKIEVVSYDKMTTTFSYSGGRIQKTSEKSEGDYSSNESYFWNGNLTKTTYNTSENESGETVYEYGDLKYINNANIDLFAYVGDFFNNMENVLMLGIAGERSWYLPTKLTTTDKADGESDTYGYKFSYVQDSEGYITRISIDSEDGEAPNIYEITYND